MNGRKAKQRRRDEALTELLLQAHDRLHKDDVDGCHEILHAALGAGEVDSSVAPLMQGSKFNAGFQRLCVAHGVRASYVMVEPADGGARLMSGGDGPLCELIDRGIRRLDEVVT